MKVSEILKQRQPGWMELEALCKSVRRKSASPEVINRMTAMYRAACADLALAEAYQFPPATVEYLHRLVARAHHRLYRNEGFEWKKWTEKILLETPQRIFKDRCVHVAFLIFWSLFLLSAFLAYDESIWPGFAASVLGEAQMDGLSSSWSQFDGRTWGENSQMFGFYIFNNAGIGLQCFAFSLLIIPGIGILAYNSIVLGTVFGYMFRPELGDASVNFQNFVTAHAPFELTAIILCSGAGLRLGISWLSTNGLTRGSSLRQSRTAALPIVMCGVILFCLAALIEGFLSPAPTHILPWALKGFVAVICSGLLTVYFVVLGYPREGLR